MMTTAPDLELDDRLLVPLSRSALYGVAAAAFRHPVDPRFLRLANPDELKALREAVRFGGGSETAHLVQLAQALHEHDKQAERDRLLATHTALFGHTSRGAVPPYETEYGTGGPFSQPQEMSDISGFYEAFGLTLDTARHERGDHICCELEFMCFLCAKEAQAISNGDDETAAEAVRTQRLFLRDHLGRFGRTFFFRVMQADPDGRHGAAAQFASAFLQAECRRFDLAVDRAYLPLRPADELNVPMACGSCSVGCGPEGPAE